MSPWDARIEQGLCYLDQSAELAQAIAGARHRLRTERACSERFTQAAEDLQQAPGAMPEFPELPLETSELFNYLLVVSQLPGMRGFYRKHGLPDDVFQASLSDLPLWVDHNRRHFGRLGISRRILNWMQNHVNGRLFGLGRLQFMPTRFPAGVQVLADEAHGSVCAASSGTLIHPSGRSLSVPFKASPEWAAVLQQDDGMLDVHIPEGEPLTTENCKAAFERALLFFPRFFPGTPFRGFYCSSWLLDPCLEDILGPASGILGFKREFYCIPGSNGHSEAVSRVFGEVGEDLSQAPQATSLQRAMLGHLLRGGVFADGAGFILREDISRYGSAQYRNRFPF